MKAISILGLLLASNLAMASQEQKVETNAFSCMDEKTFAINSECMVEIISDHNDYKASQTFIQERAEKANSRVLSTIIFDEKTLTTSVIALSDAILNG